MKFRAYLFVIASFASLSVFATEKIRQNDDLHLLSSCQSLIATSEHENTESCKYFIQGFLANAQAINSLVKDEQTNKKYKPYRTKGRTLPSGFYHFCIPVNESNELVIKTVAKQLSPQIVSVKMLRDTILKIFKTEYPCNQLSQN